MKTIVNVPSLIPDVIKINLNSSINITSINTPINVGVNISTQISQPTIKFDLGMVPGPKGSVGLGFPNGGTEGQIITKKSDNDHDVEWSSLQDLTLLFNNQII